MPAVSGVLEAIELLRFHHMSLPALMAMLGWKLRPMCFNAKMVDDAFTHRLSQIMAML